ncbi:MAG: HD domain-containing protein [Clostridia bacterium]|nr:HD domain-containing protein [Clostridia bacterium]
MNEKLIEYIETNIFPEYSKNDDGHGIEHINYVIERSFRFAEQFENIDLNMLYAIASFHDIAHHIDKNNHEKLSAQIFYENEDMKSFFTDDQRIVIKEAIEDHRASANHLPRSDYGKIISSADRSTSIKEFLTRTHSFTLNHHPDLTIEQIIERGYSHTKDKYGFDGYAKSFVYDVEYIDFLNKINELLSDYEKYEIMYRQINNI